MQRLSASRSTSPVHTQPSLHLVLIYLPLQTRPLLHLVRHLQLVLDVGTDLGVGLLCPQGLPRLSATSQPCLPSDLSSTPGAPLRAALVLGVGVSSRGRGREKPAFSLFVAPFPARMRRCSACELPVRAACWPWSAEEGICKMVKCSYACRLAHLLSLVIQFMF